MALGLLKIFAPSLIRVAEWGIKGLKRGPQRKSWLVDIGKAYLKLQGEDADEEAIGGLFEAVFQELKMKGGLDVNPEGDLYLVRATSIQKLDV